MPPRGTPYRLAPGRDHLEYRIDDNDVIVATAGAWDDTARANDAEELVGGAVVGTSLFAAIDDPRLVHLWRVLLERCRQRAEELPLSLAFDGPTTRRWLRLTLRPEPDGGITFTSTVVRSEPRPVIALLDRRATRTGHAQLDVCAWCGRVEVGREWIAVEAAVSSLELSRTSSTPVITHGICPLCFEAVSRRALRGKG